MSVNDEQREFWSDQAGGIWVAQAKAMDAVLAPVLDAVLHAADLRKGQHVVDVGCGAGTSSFLAADAVGTEGTVCGLDISDTLLAAASADPRRTGSVDFRAADAQTHTLPSPRFDRLISRFGVMFFQDTAEAFSNMQNWLVPGARVAFATWGAIGENPFFTLPAAISKDHFGPRPKTDPDAPGPFALRDADKVCAVLRAVGFTEVAVDVRKLALTPAGNAADLAALMCQIGPAQSALIILMQMRPRAWL